MPRFFFHIRDGLDLVDREGLVLDGLEDARLEAIKGARSIMAEELKQGRLVIEDRIEVTDEHGQVLLVVPFQDAVEVQLGNSEGATS